MKPNIPILLTINAALLLSGCAMWNKYDLRQTKVTAPTGSTSVAVACVDERETLRQGDIRPELIGVTRSGFGVPYRVKTASKAPVAAEIAAAVTDGFGPNRKLAPPISMPDAASALAALRSTGTDRQILIRIENFNSDTLIRTELDYAFVVEVYDSKGKLLARASQKEVADLGGNGLLPAMHARQAVLSRTGKALTQLLSAPQIQENLH